MSASHCHISFRGPFTVRDGDSRDMTPKGAKARALMALLAEPPLRRRSRRWLEAHLWSESDRTRASGSLRTALAEIRRALGPAQDILGSDRQDAWLDPARVSTDLDPGAATVGAGREILEGFDIRDEEFEDWLRVLRSCHEVEATGAAEVLAPVTLTRGLRMRCSGRGEGGALNAVVAQQFSDQIGQALEERMAGQRIDGAAAAAEIDISVNIVEEPGLRVVQVRIMAGAGGQILYSGTRTVPRQGQQLLSDHLLAEFGNDAAVQASLRMPQALNSDMPEIAALASAQQAQALLFGYRPESLHEAERLMRVASDTVPHGPYLGWRVFISMARVIETLEPISEEMSEEVEALLRTGLERSPGNGEMFALVSLARTLFFDDAEAGVEAAQIACRLNGHSLLARQALALSAAGAGETESAYRISSRCQPALGQTPSRHLWDLYHSLVCIRTGRVDEARLTAERAVRLCPEFRAPRRQLLGLLAHTGETEAARAHAEVLGAQEPGFTMDRYLRDPDYPVVSLRSAGLLAGDAARRLD